MLASLETKASSLTISIMCESLPELLKDPYIVCKLNLDKQIGVSLKQVYMTL